MVQPVHSHVFIQEKEKPYKYFYAFIKACFVTAQNQKLSKYTTTGKWINKVGYPYNRKNEQLIYTFVTTQNNNV